MLESLISYLNKKEFTNCTRINDEDGICLTANKNGVKVGFAINKTDNPITAPYIYSIYNNKSSLQCNAIVLAATHELNTEAVNLAKELKIMVWDKQHLEKIGVSEKCPQQLNIGELKPSKPMKALVCEMCGSNDIIKKEGLYVCQSCGTKYTTEEAQKLMIDVSVKIDKSDDLQDLYISAKEAEVSGNDTTARKLYETILKNDPTNWQPIFFTTCYGASDCSVNNMIFAITSVNNCLSSVIEKIYNSANDDEQKQESLKRVVNKVCVISSNMVDIAEKEYNNSKALSKDDDFVNRKTAIAKTCFNLGDLIDEHWVECKSVYPLISKCYLTGLGVAKRGMPLAKYQKPLSTLALRYVEKVPKYSPSCQNDRRYLRAKEKDGCFIATAVYGSYDCPEVWTLRRFRDYSLALTWYGRLFITLYYAISPTIVKWFSHTTWFNKMWKGKLDRIVKKLQSEGYENTPYDDKDWK